MHLAIAHAVVAYCPSCQGPLQAVAGAVTVWFLANAAVFTAII